MILARGWNVDGKGRRPNRQNKLFSSLLKTKKNLCKIHFCLNYILIYLLIYLFLFSKTRTHIQCSGSYSCGVAQWVKDCPNLPGETEELLPAEFRGPCSDGD